jgi:hypothetical protein
LTKDEEDDPDDQDDDADRPQNADAQDPAQDQQDETKNNHVSLLVLFYPKCIASHSKLLAVSIAT